MHTSYIQIKPDSSVLDLMYIVPHIHGTALKQTTVIKMRNSRSLEAEKLATEIDFGLFCPHPLSILEDCKSLLKKGGECQQEGEVD